MRVQSDVNVNTVAKNSLNDVGALMQNCLTTVEYVQSDVTINAVAWSGLPQSCRSFNNVSLLTVSKAFVKSTKTIYISMLFNDLFLKQSFFEDHVQDGVVRGNAKLVFRKTTSWTRLIRILHLREGVMVV